MNALVINAASRGMARRSEVISGKGASQEGSGREGDGIKESGAGEAKPFGVSCADSGVDRTARYRFANLRWCKAPCLKIGRKADERRTTHSREPGVATQAGRPSGGSGGFTCWRMLEDRRGSKSEGPSWLQRFREEVLEAAAEITGKGEALTGVEDDDIVAVGGGLKLADAIEVHERGAVDASEAGRGEAGFER